MANGHPDMPMDCKTAIPDDGQGQGKKQARAKKENAKAVAYYTMEFKSAILRATINKAKTDEWPGGEAWMINAALIKKYRPDDIIAAAEARRRLNDVSMKKYNDPAVLFEQLAEIEVAYAGTTIKITEQDCIGVVFATAAEKYHSVLTSEQRTKGAGLTMDDLEDAMNQLWIQGGGRQKKHTGNDGGEMVLSAFGGTCYNCQEKGHIANQCPRKDGPNNGYRNASGNTGGKFKGECNNCGKIRHKKSDCWQLDDVHKRKEDIVIEIDNDNTDEGKGENEKPADPGNVEDNGTDDKSEDDSSDEEPVEEDEPWNDVTTRSGRSVRAPSRLIAEVGASALGLTKAEENYYALLDQGGEAEFDPEELICIGAALGGRFENTQELHVNK
jgi:hypothetical protein